MSGDAIRVDIWLWRARFFKTRSDAGKAAANGKVRLERFGQMRRLSKACATVRCGDILTFMRAGRINTVRVNGLGERRGPACEAQTLYEAIDCYPESALQS